MLDIRDHGGGYGGGGVQKNAIVPAGKFIFSDMAESLFRRTTIATSTSIYAFALNKATNEVYALSKNERKIYVLDAATGDIKRNFIVSTTNPTNVVFNELTVSDNGRLYIGFYSTFAYVAEINPNTGAVIKQTGLSSNDRIWLMEVINGQVHVGHWTGTIDIFDLDLNNRVAKSYNNSVENTEYGAHVDIEKNIILYPQTSNNQTVMKRYTDGLGGVSLWGNGNQSAVTTKDYVVVAGSSTVYKYSLTGTLIAQMTLYYQGTSALSYVGKPKEMYPNIVAVPYENTSMYGVTIVNLETMKQVYIDHIALTPGTGSQFYTKTLLINDRIFLAAGQEYTLQRMYQKLL